MAIRLILWLVSRQYKKYGKDIFYISGIGKDFPKYLIYTENYDTRNKMRKFKGVD